MLNKTNPYLPRFCKDCGKKIIPNRDLIDFDDEGNVYHWKCLLNKRSCEAEESEL